MEVKAMQSRATAEWTGDLMGGQGKVSAASGTFKGASLSWKARTRGQPTRPPPRSCSPRPTPAASPWPSRTRWRRPVTPRSGWSQLRGGVRAQVRRGVRGPLIGARGEGSVPGMNAAEFEKAAEGAKSGCPISLRSRSRCRSRPPCRPRSPRRPVGWEPRRREGQGQGIPWPEARATSGGLRGQALIRFLSAGSGARASALL